MDFIGRIHYTHHQKNKQYQQMMMMTMIKRRTEIYEWIQHDKISISMKERQSISMNVVEGAEGDGGSLSRYNLEIEERL